jgi:hypothetical protein
VSPPTSYIRVGLALAVSALLAVSFLSVSYPLSLSSAHLGISVGCALRYIKCIASMYTCQWKKIKLFASLALSLLLVFHVAQLYQQLIDD